MIKNLLKKDNNFQHANYYINGISKYMKWKLIQVQGKIKSTIEISQLNITLSFERVSSVNTTCT
jgi:hypothetical protein